MVDRTFRSFVSSVKADRKEDNRKRPGAGAAEVFARPEVESRPESCPLFLRNTSKAGLFDKVGTDPAPGARPIPLPEGFSGVGVGHGAPEKCMENLL